MLTAKHEQRRVFSKRLVDAMRIANYSQMDLVRSVSAELPGEETVSRQFVSMLVKGLSMPGAPIMLAICKVLNVRPSDLDPSEFGVSLDPVFETMVTATDRDTTKLLRGHLEALPKNVERAPEVPAPATNKFSFPQPQAELDLSSSTGLVRVHVDKEVTIDKAFRIWEILNS